MNQKEIEKEKLEADLEDIKQGILPDLDHAKVAWKLTEKSSEVIEVLFHFFEADYFSDLISKVGVEETKKYLTEMDAFMKEIVVYQSLEVKN